MMIRYRHYFTDLNENWNVEKHIEGLIDLGFSIGEIMEMIKADPQAVVDTLDSFAKDQMNRIKYNKVMERLGYDEERVETKKSII